MNTPPIVIEKGIPRPGCNSGLMYEAVKQMDVDDSFFLPGEKRFGSLGYIERKFQIKLSIRAVEGGIRVWRIK